MNKIQKLYNKWFQRKSYREDNWRLRTELLELKREMSVLRAGAASAKTMVGKGPKIEIPIAGFDDLTYEPIDAENRQGYIERVDEFYTDILQKKLYVSISQLRELYGNAYMESLGVNVSRGEYDWFTRGMEAGLFKIDEWCNTLKSERASILQENENNKE